MAEILDIKNLSKNFSGKTVLENVSFQIQSGESVALVGANGAGKSTLIKIILSLVKETGGAVSVFSKSKNAEGVKKQIGYLPEVSGFWEELSAFQLLKFMGTNKHVSQDKITSRSEKILKAMGLFKRGNGDMGTYSKGMLQRTGIAQALINNPDFIILDEPMSGLDPRAQEKLRIILEDLNNAGKTLLISSHSLEDVKRLCGRTLVLEKGQLIQDGSTDKVLSFLNERYQRDEPWDEDPLGKWDGKID